MVEYSCGKIRIGDQGIKMETVVVAFIGCLLFLIFIDSILIWDMKRHWIDKKGHYHCWWDGYWDKKQAKRWLIIWSTVIAFNLVLYSVLSWIFLDATLVVVFALSSYIFYIPVVGIAYLIVKYQIIWRFEN